MNKLILLVICLFNSGCENSLKKPNKEESPKELSILIDSADLVFNENKSSLININFTNESHSFIHVIEPFSYLSFPELEIKHNGVISSFERSNRSVSLSSYKVIILEPSQSVSSEFSISVDNKGRLDFANGMQIFNVRNGVHEIRLKLPVTIIDLESGKCHSDYIFSDFLNLKVELKIDDVENINDIEKNESNSGDSLPEI